MTEHLTTTPVTAELLRGVIELEHTADGVLPHRIPRWAREQLPDPQLLMVESQTSGVRVAFTTTATVIELETRPTKIAYVGAPPRPDGVYELLVDGTLSGLDTVLAGNTLQIDMTTGSAETRPGPTGSARFAGLSSEPKHIEIWLPHNETTELIALRTDAPVEPSPSADPVWLHHGSSISHGSNATAPTAIWPAVAAAAGGVDLVNLGLGGSAMLDPFTARTMRDIPADLISLKIGINLVNGDLMRMRAFTPAVHGFLDTIRDGHPDTPLLVVTPIWCPIHEDTPGPAAPDFSDGQVRFVAMGDPAEVARGRLALAVIREELARIVAQRATDDPNLHLLSGLELYGEADHDRLPLPDGLHPDTATHRLMGERFADLAFAEGGPLHRAGALAR